MTLPEWLEELRATQVTARVRNDPRTVFVGEPLGIKGDRAVREVAGWGQADFDKPCGGFSPFDRVLLYAHYLQRGHIEELTTAFRMLLAGSLPSDPVIIELGCGPFTGGLAFAAAFGVEQGFGYIGVDRSRVMCQLGEQLASAAPISGEMRRHWAQNLSAVRWDPAPGWRPVFVIVSYLLASPTVDVAMLISELDTILARVGRGSVTVLYTNSAQQHANRDFFTLRTALERIGFSLSKDDTGVIQIERQGRPRNRFLRYALFFRAEQKRLPLGSR